MSNTKRHTTEKDRRQARVRGKIFGTADRPRLSVFRSNQHLYLQAINDEQGQTLAAASDLDLTKTKVKESKLEKARLVAEYMAQALQKKKIKQVVFDRGYCRYHGRVKQVAETLRTAGIKL